MKTKKLAEKLRDFCTTHHGSFVATPGTDVQRAMDQFSESDIEKMVDLGWIEDRGHYVLTSTGYNAI